MTASDIAIRPEGPSDGDGIRAVHEAAFGKPGEARIVADARASDRFVPELSLVGERDGHIVGHVLVSYVDLVRRDDEVRVLQLGPIGVLPHHQRRGVGSALVHAAIEAADARGEPLIALLGDPRFYGRFGFRLSRGLGIEPPPTDPADHFMAVLLRAYDPRLRGTIRYSPAFTDNA